MLTRAEIGSRTTAPANGSREHASRGNADRRMLNPAGVAHIVSRDDHGGLGHGTQDAVTANYLWRRRAARKGIAAAARASRPGSGSTLAVTMASEPSVKRILNDRLNSSLKLMTWAPWTPWSDSAAMVRSSPGARSKTSPKRAIRR